MERQQKLRITKKMTLMTVLLCMTVVFSVNTEAASKKKMYVVTKISSGNKVYVPNTKVSYTSDGLISKTDTDNKWDRRICSYNYTNGKATSGTEKWGWKGTPIKKVMTYKNGHLNRITIKENGAEEQYCYIWKKGKCIRVDSNYRDSEGESSYQKGLYEYKYNKKGLIVFERTPATFRYKYDKKKNIKSYTLASADEERRDFHFKNKYKKGLLKKAKVTGKLGYDKNVKIKSFKVKYYYKKIKVPKKYVKKIKAQQHRIITGVGPDLAAY